MRSHVRATSERMANTDETRAKFNARNSDKGSGGTLRLDGMVAGSFRLPRGEGWG